VSWLRPQWRYFETQSGLGAGPSLGPTPEPRVAGFAISHRRIWDLPLAARVGKNSLWQREANLSDG